ncbi:MAG: hypothetical protein VX589_04470 [Myxococcota bacterium]|nr:hypothetical protein [Myxococcota bacterium]
MQSLDIPQANALETVRQIIRAIDLGVTRVESLADYTDYSTRHVSYRLHAARILGFVRLHGDEAELTPLGERLLVTKLRSEQERAVYYDAVQGSAVIQLLVPDLLSLMPPSAEHIAERLFTASKLSRSTSTRRANGLMAWRKYILGHQSAPRPSRSTAPKEKAPVAEPTQLSLFEV